MLVINGRPNSGYRGNIFTQLSLLAPSLDGKTVTLSFFIKRNNGTTSDIIVYLENDTLFYTASCTDEWVRKSTTFVYDKSTNLSFGCADTDSFSLSQIQLEEGYNTTFYKAPSEDRTRVTAQLLYGRYAIGSDGSKKQVYGKRVAVKTPIFGYEDEGKIAGAVHTNNLQGGLDTLVKVDGCYIDCVPDARSTHGVNNTTNFVWNQLPDIGPASNLVINEAPISSVLIGVERMYDVWFEWTYK